MVGFTIAGNQNAPRVRDQNSYMFRDDFTLNYDARGRHDLKAGGEYLLMDEFTRNCRNCMSQIDAREARSRRRSCRRSSRIRSTPTRGT